MAGEKQVHVIKLSAEGMRWSSHRGDVVIRGRRSDIESDRPYHLVIDNVDDMRRMVTHLQNAIAGIEAYEGFQRGDVVRIKDSPAIEYEIVQAIPGMTEGRGPHGGRGIARLRMLTEPQEITVTWRAFEVLELVRRPERED
jgi:hypothetical protein